MSSLDVSERAGSRSHGSKNRGTGFTLIELMIAVVVMAILAVVALPSYQAYIMKGRRASAIQEIASAQQAQERYRSNRASYATTFGATGFPNGSTGNSYDTRDGHYSLTLSAADSTGYTLSARPTPGGLQANDSRCALMQVQMLRGNAVYSSADAASSATQDCWPR